MNKDSYFVNSLSMDFLDEKEYNIYIRYGKSTKKKKEVVKMKIKNLTESCLVLIAIGFIFWLICSYVNVITNNDTAQAISNYADWNAFKFFSEIIK